MVGMKASGFTYNPSRNKLKADGTVESYDFNRIKVSDFRKFYL